MHGRQFGKVHKGCGSQGLCVPLDEDRVDPHAAVGPGEDIGNIQLTSSSSYWPRHFCRGRTSFMLRAPPSLKPLTSYIKHQWMENLVFPLWNLMIFSLVFFLLHLSLNYQSGCILLTDWHQIQILTCTYAHLWYVSFLFMYMYIVKRCNFFHLYMKIKKMNFKWYWLYLTFFIRL